MTSVRDRNTVSDTAFLGTATLPQKAAGLSFEQDHYTPSIRKTSVKRNRNVLKSSPFILAKAKRHSSEELHKIHVFYSKNADFFNPCPSIDFDNILKDGTLACSDAFLSEKLPILVYFFEMFQANDLRKNFINIFSLFIVRNLQARALRYSSLKPELLAPAISCCLLLNRENIALLKNSIHYFFCNQYSYNVKNKNVLFEKIIFLYDFFYCSLCLLDILQKGIFKDTDLINNISECILSLCREWSDYFHFLPSAIVEFKAIELSLQSMPLNIEYVCLKLSNIKTYIFQELTKIRFSDKIKEEINIISPHTVNSIVFRKLNKGMEDLEKEIMVFESLPLNPNTYEDIRQKYYSILMSFMNSCLFMKLNKSKSRKINRGKEINRNKKINKKEMQVISAVCASPFFLVEHCMFQLFENKERPNSPLEYTYLFDTIKSMTNELIGDAHGANDSVSHLSYFIEEFMHFLSKNNNNFYSFCIPEKITDILDTLNEHEQAHRHQSMFPVVFYTHNTTEASCFVVDFSQKIAMVDPNMNQSYPVFDELKRRYSIITFPKQFNGEENALKCPLIAAKLAVSLLKSEYIYFMREIQLNQNNNVEPSPLIDFFEQELSGKIRKYQSPSTQTKDRWFYNRYTSNNNLRTVFKYQSLF
jgi:predicted transcriptional regulator